MRPFRPPFSAVFACAVSVRSVRTAAEAAGADRLVPEPLIVNGNDVEPERAFAFMASLTQNRDHSCGGTLVAPDIVLTAAHCWESFGEVQLGRHNIRDFTEIYESHVVQQIVRHPQHYSNYFADNDPYDVAVVKIFGRSDIPPVPLAQADRPPMPKDTPLRAMGWGTTDPSLTPAYHSILQETTLFYLPNEQCKQSTGVHNNVNVEFQNRVIDVSLCAINTIDATDTCQGDSGGPLLASTQSLRGTEHSNNGTASIPFDPQRPAVEQFVQVGITSSGFGCAHPTLPGLYVRISHVREWIDEIVCRETEYPSDYPSCDASSLPSFAFDNDDTITLRIAFDTDVSPNERGWLLRTPNEDSDVLLYEQNNNPTQDSARSLPGEISLGNSWTTLVYKPVFSYDTSQRFTTVMERVVVPNNRQYIFTFLDSAGNGHSMLLGKPNLVIVDETNSITLFNSTDNNSGGDFLFRYHYSLLFTAGTPPTSAPTVTSMPTRSAAPTSAPTDIGQYISLLLQFQQRPDEIGYRLERILLNGDYEVLHIAYPGNYDAFNDAGTTVTERLSLRLGFSDEESPAPVTYRLTMTSNEGRGFGAGGKYSGWLGPVGLGELLFEGGDFGLEAVHTFEVVPWTLPPSTTLDVDSPLPSPLPTNEPVPTPPKSAAVAPSWLRVSTATTIVLTMSATIAAAAAADAPDWILTFM